MKELDNTFHSLIDQDEVSYRVTQEFNRVFGSNVSNLSKVVQLVEELQITRDHLQQRLQFATTEAPDKITRAVKGAEKALGEGEHLLGESVTLQKQVKTHISKYARLLGEVEPGVRKVVELGRVEAYQALLSTVEEWSKDISSSLHIGAEGQALLGHARLLEGALAVKGTECGNLFDFLHATLLHWNNTLVRRFTSEFEGVLKSIKWPLVGEAGGGHLPASPDSLQRLCTLTQYLVQLSLPECLAARKKKEGEGGASTLPAPPSPPATTAPPAVLSNFEPLILPVQLMINPLQVRFLYHFTGARATNSQSHPEWYYIQLLKWVTAHDNFLTHRIQPVLDRCGKTNVSAKVEFMRGLVHLAAIKVGADLPHLREDEDFFSTTVQETLHFERELCDIHGYPRTQPSILCVLTDCRVFPRWLALERKFALEVMDELVSSEGAWAVEEWGGGGGGGETARCGEQVILLVQGITDRYKRLPQPGHRLQFLELQLDLLDDYRVRLLQVMKSEKHDPLNSNYPAILNTTHHLSATLADWAYLPFFIEMQYYRESFLRAQEATNTPSPTSPSLSHTPLSPHHPDDPPSPTSSSSLLHPSSSSPSSPLSSSSPPTPDHVKYEPVPPSSTQLAHVTGSVFQSTHTLYTHIEGEMVHTLAMYVFSEVRARSLPYRRDRWHKCAREEDGSYVHRGANKVTEVSPSICPLLEVLARHLHALRDCLATPLFHTLWGKVAETLDKYIFEELVLETRFSVSGASQFKFDMTRALFPIFGEFTQKPENYFRLVKESTILLTLARGTVVLLQDTLSGGDCVVAPHRALAEHGVTRLTAGEASAVLNARLYDAE